MNITKRTAKIGNAIQSRSEMHGEDAVTAIDIPLSDIMLNRGELNDILREPLAYLALFNTRTTGSGLDEPLLKHVKPLALDEKIEGAAITITHGVDAQVLRLAPVKLAKIKLDPKLGGLTSMSCTVQCTPDLDVNIAHLLDRLNSTVEVEIDGGEFGAQAELPLTAQQEGDGEATGDDAGEDDAPLNTHGNGEEPPKRRGRPRKNAEHAIAH